MSNFWLAFFNKLRFLIFLMKTTQNGGIINGGVLEAQLCGMFISYTKVII